MNLKIYFSQAFAVEADLFARQYDMVQYETMPERRIPNLKKGKKLVCRFCNQTEPAVSFKKDAHMIPDYLGNRHLLSDDECDSCNEKFGKTYEDHFAKYLGISRTINKVRGREGVPTFNSNSLKAKKESFFGIQDSIVISKLNDESDLLEFNLDTGIATIKSTKQKHIPLWAYKALLKMALSALDKDVIKYYGSAFRFLMTDSLDLQLAKICNCREYRMPLGFGYEEPFILFFKKRDSSSRLPTHIFVLFFKNVLYEIFLPLNDLDSELYDGNIFSVSWCPPIFLNEEDSVNIPVRHYDIDLSSPNETDSDKEIITFRTNEENLNKLVRIDELTGRQSPIDPKNHGTKKMILVPPGTQINLSKLRGK
jgi:hypothetical protein